MIAAEEQIRLIAEVADTLAQGGLKAWLFGGWGIDAHAGYVTRAHGDVEFWIERSDKHSLRHVLAARGFELLSTQPPEESFEFERDGQRFSTAFFDRVSDGSSKPTGRWADWLFPPGAFQEERRRLGGTSVRVMSLEGLLAMKVQYPSLKNGKPLRPKDQADIAILEAILTMRVTGLSYQSQATRPVRFAIHFS